MKVLIILVLLALAGCANDHHDMQNGYLHVHSNTSDQHIINQRQHTVIETNVIRYAYNQNWIIGYKVASLQNDLPQATQAQGYFYLDIKRNTLNNGLSKSKLQAFIIKQGLEQQTFQVCQHQQCSSNKSLFSILH